MLINQIYKEIEGFNGRPIGIDIHFAESNKAMPIVIFAHGYKGFKDFGAWSLIGDQMAEQGVVFIRFNFSHNGVTTDNPLEFNDLDAFGKNNYSIEVADFNAVIDYINSLAKERSDWDENDINIIGHSRGGGIAILTAAENKNVSSLITWAAINSTFNRMPIGEDLGDWKDRGVRYVINGRTKQEMPHYFPFYEDLIQNKDELDIEKKSKTITIPWLIIHGDSDEAVPLQSAIELKAWNPNSKLQIIENGNHTFSISHPWKADKLSEEMKKVFDFSIQFVLNK